jgi:hypothetical protein
MPCKTTKRRESAMKHLFKATKLGWEAVEKADKETQALVDE